MTGKRIPLRNMQRKSDIVRTLVASGQYKQALRIAKDFRLGISEDDSDAMKRGYECLVHPNFYQQIGYNTDNIAQKGIETLIKLYGT